MIYRVCMKISYYERCFDFDDMEMTSIFATNILMHQVPSEDHPKKEMYVTIQVIMPKDENEKEEN